MSMNRQCPEQSVDSAITPADGVSLQLAQQAMLWDLSNMSQRRFTADRLAEVYCGMVLDAGVTVAVEVGAHEASFALSLRELSEKIKIFAYEGNPLVFKKMARENNFSERNIMYENAVVADIAGHGGIHIYAAIDGKDEPADGKRHSILTRAGRDCPVKETLPVRSLTLDSRFAHPEFADDVFALWIDAEGAGREVLLGAKSVLRSTALVYVEVESVAKFVGQALDRDIVELLLKEGFIPILRDFQFRHQYNLVAVRKDCYPLIEHAYLNFLSHRATAKIRWVGGNT